MVASSTDLFSGIVAISISAKQARRDSAPSLAYRMDCFIKALSARMFAPGRLRKFELNSSRGADATNQRELWEANLELETTPIGVFQVLRGMLRYHDAIWTPLQSYSAIPIPGTRDLLASPHAHVSPAPAYPFAVTIQPQRPSGPPLNIDIEFLRPPAAEDRPQILAHFAWWDELICGGYPARSDRDRFSGCGRSHSRFVLPTIAHHHHESWEADPICFVPILNLVKLWAELYGVKSLTIR